MSTRLIRCLKHLQASGFLRSLDDAATPQLELLTHGSVYAHQLQEHWLTMRSLAANLGSVTCAESLNQSRFSFVHSKQFREQIQRLRQAHPSKAKCPTLLKHHSICPSECMQSNSIYQLAQPVTKLITDFYVTSHRGLEHFYNVQRESKIWWMRYSSNPSRYAIVPLTGVDHAPGCQAIDIRASFDAASFATVEQLSLVPLPDEQDFYLPDARTGIPQLPTVIRSVIDLEPACCALLLDGCDHGREARSLLLNRLLAPYQCAIVGIRNTEDSTHDLRDLCAHVADVLQRACLRLQDKGFAMMGKGVELTQQLELYDRLGVPYALLVDDQQTLSNGLLQLRSRDTQLAEMVHISDLPDYLLNIFRDY